MYRTLEPFPRSRLTLVAGASRCDPRRNPTLSLPCSAQGAKALHFSEEFNILDPLCVFFRFRLAKSGQGIVELTGGTGKVFATELRKYNLFALPLEALWGILLMPYAKYMTSGSAPKGRLERLVAKHLPANNK